MRYALIDQNGENHGTILWDGISPYMPPPGYTLLPEAEAPPMASEPVPVPVEVEMAQARLALFHAGLMPSVAAALAAAGEAVQIEWEFRPTVRRNSALVASIGAALGLTDAQIDALFIDAAGR